MFINNMIRINKRKGEKMFRMYSDLCEIIICDSRKESEECKEAAWEKLLKLNPSNYILRYLLKNALGKYQKKAAEELSKRELKHDDIWALHDYAPSPYANYASNLLIKKQEG